MNTLPILIAAGALSFVGANAIAQASGPLEVRTTMKGHVNPAMLAIWDVTNHAVDDTGALDPSKIDAAKWDSLAAAAGRLAHAGHDMATAGQVIAARPENSATGDGEITMAAVEQHLSGDPAGFRAKAAEFARHSEALAAAATARDAIATGNLVTEMDAVCESCHAEFWYPE